MHTWSFAYAHPTVHVIVATPGRIIDLMQKGIANVSQCHILVLDEVCMCVCVCVFVCLCVCVCLCVTVCV